MLLGSDKWRGPTRGATVLFRLLPLLLLTRGIAASRADELAIPPTITSYENDLADTCRDAGGKPSEPTRGFLERGDFNGDGIEDWAFNEGKYNCEGAWSIFTGSGGSQVVVFIALPNGDARRAFQSGAFGMQKSSGSSTLWLGVGGPLCGQEGNPTHAGSVLCDRPLVWVQSTQSLDFAPLSRIHVPSAITP